MRRLGLLICLVLTGFSCAPSLVMAGAFIFAGEANGIDVVAHPTGYVGTGGVVTVRVCQGAGDGNGAALVDWEQSVHNMIAVYNKLQPTTGNLKGLASSASVDWESVALHELGHCIGQAHPNAATESGLPEAQRNYTKATDGADNTFNVDAGSDGYIGSADDVRGDDINLHWFWTENNNPFMIDYSRVDSTNYARDTINLPGTDLFATNADRDVGDDLLDAFNSESVMQQGSFSYETQRTLGHDDVATLRYAMSGVNETAGDGDDYTINLEFSTSPNCDVTLSFNDLQTGFAVCSTGGFFIGNSDHIRINDANAYFNSGYNWHFNTDKPCTQTISLTQDVWRMFSLSCLVGISTDDTVADILGDDMGGTYNVDWAVFERDAVTDTYTQLSLASEMETGKGYWVQSLLAGQSFDVEGQYSSSPDIYLSGAAGGRWNMIGHPLDYSVSWSDTQVLDGPDMLSISDVNTTTEMSKYIHYWNGNTYDAYDDVTPGMEGTLEAGKAYWVEAYQDGLRLRVPTLPTALTTPASVSATNGTYPDKVVVSWNDPGEGATQFQVNRWDHTGGGSCSGFPNEVYGSVSGDITTFEDTNPTDPDGYCYRVRACWGGEVYPRGDGCSAWSSLYLGSVSASAVVQESVALEEVVIVEAFDGREPAAESGHGQRPKPKVDHRKVREDGAWYVRIIAEADGMLDRGAVLGRLAGSVDGQDSHDLEKRAPFGSSYLSVLFPHEEWGDDSWGFASDYRSLGRKSSDEWSFAVYVSSDVDEVSLSFEGPAAVLEKSKLTQLGVKGKAVTRKGKNYTFTPVPGYNYFTFRVDKK